MCTASVLQPRSPLRPFAMPFVELGSVSVDRKHVLVNSCGVKMLGHGARTIPVVTSFHDTSRDNSNSTQKNRSVLNGSHIRKVKELDDSERTQNRAEDRSFREYIRPEVTKNSKTELECRSIDTEREVFRDCQVGETRSQAHVGTTNEVPDGGDWNMDDNLCGLPWGSFSFPLNVSKGPKEDPQRGGSTIKGEEVATYMPSPKLEENRTPPEAEEDSTGYETDTDYGEGDSPDSYGNSLACHDLLKINTQDEAPRRSLIRPILSPLKQEIVDRLMNEFWVIFNQEWQSNIKSYASTPSTSAGSPESQMLSQSSSNPQNRKRRLEDNNDLDSDDGGGDAKRSNQIPSSPTKLKERADFACPYRKHDSRKYNVRSWRSCALTPLAGVSRVKGHLYRHHMIFQCPRCKTLCKDQPQLDEHFTVPRGCELISTEPAEGITANIEKRLRSRKKTHRNQSEEDRWREIYRILFPADDIPSPYFEALQDSAPQSPSSQDLTNYEEYSRRELPRIFQRALETAVDNESQPIAERLLRQLPDLIRDCQDTLFSNYRAGLSDAYNEVPHQAPPPPRVGADSSLPYVGNSLKGPETTRSRDTGYESDSPFPPSPYSQNTKEGDTDQKSSLATKYDNTTPLPNYYSRPDITSDHLPQTQLQDYNLVTPDEMWGPIPTDMEMEFVNWNQPSDGGII